MATESVRRTNPALRGKLKSGALHCVGPRTGQYACRNIEGETNPYKTIHSKFTPKSNWLPNNTHISLKNFKIAFKNNLLFSKTPQNQHNNLNKAQTARILTLCNNPEIVIKKADKGSAVIVMITKNYIRKGYRQLMDQKFYTKIDKDYQSQIKF